jgi:hypothetical protein
LSSKKTLKKAYFSTFFQNSVGDTCFVGQQTLFAGALSRPFRLKCGFKRKRCTSRDLVRFQPKSAGFWPKTRVHLRKERFTEVFTQRKDPVNAPKRRYSRPDPCILRSGLARRVVYQVHPGNGHVHSAFRTTEKNRSGPQRHKFPPRQPKSPRDDFSLQATRRA